MSAIADVTVRSKACNLPVPGGESKILKMFSGSEYVVRIFTDDDGPIRVAVTGRVPNKRNSGAVFRDFSTVSIHS